MFSRRAFLGSAAGLALPSLSPVSATALTSNPLSFVDRDGVWRWASGEEVALFGVNYDLPSASAFRFAKQSGMPFERIVEADLVHLKRLGFNGLRLCFWGDWENSTAEGAFVSNEHSDVLDLVVQRAGELGFKCLFSPFVTYDASWPDSMQRPRNGIANAFKKEELGRLPRAIAAQVRYWRELLNHRNPLTRRRYAEEPAIAAVELINEPWHHTADPALSVKYINTLSEAVRSTGYGGPIFHNVSQDMGIAPAIAASKANGATFAWYPTGLQTGHEVEGNGLLLVERYEQFKDPALSKTAKLVYEFDAPDTMSSYFYPAMVRAFREGGAQFAAMFAYDSLPISRSNSEFNDHFLNLVATPAKAISALIAATAMRELPRAKDVAHGSLRERFGPVRVDDRENLSELVDERRYFHSNDTMTAAPKPASLEHLAGVGSSPLVSYDGAGSWFLDRVEPGVWRLEVHPDAALIDNPFGFRRPERPAVRIVGRFRQMRIDLPDLGDSFLVSGVSGQEVKAVHGGFEVGPGVYRLSRLPTSISVDPTFFTLAGEQFEPIIQHAPPMSRTEGVSWMVAADVVSPKAPTAVTLHVRKQGNRFAAIKMRPGSRFRYSAVVPADLMKEGEFAYFISAEGPDGEALAPFVEETRPGDWDFPRSGGFRLPVVAAKSPLCLLDAEAHRDAIRVPYGGYSEQPSIQVGPGFGGDTAIRLKAAGLKDAPHGDLPAQRSWNGRLDDEGRSLKAFSAVEIVGNAATSEPLTVLVFLIERDGTAWGVPVTLTDASRSVRVQLRDLRPLEAAMLPRDFPVGINPYFLRKRLGRGGPGDKLRLDDLQAVQVALRRDRNPRAAPSAVAEIRRLSLVA